MYRHLPIPFQNLACSVFGWTLQRDRYGGRFEEVLAAAESRAEWDDEQVISYRDSRLRSFLRECHTHVPFYRELFDQVGADPSDISGLSDLSGIPTLTKDQAKARRAEIRSPAIPDKDVRAVHTSGTTGGGFRFVTTRQAIQEQWAVWWRYRRWHGIRRGTWCAYFGGRSVVPVTQSGPPYWRYNQPARQILFSGYHMNPRNLDAYVGELRRRRPPWVHGYPSLLALLARYMLEHDVDLGYPIRWVTVGAENLLANHRLLLEEAFGVSPHEHYGMAEGIANISECEAGSLHVDEDFAAVEFLDQGDGTARIVGTNYSNPAFPLVRFEVGDVAVLGGNPCSCGRPGRIVERIDGRLEDYVIRPDGSRVGRLDHVFKDLEAIREAQILQHEHGQVEVRVVRGPDYGPTDEEMLLAELAERLGADVPIKILYVDAVQRTPAGKLRLVISRVPAGKIDG